MLRRLTVRWSVPTLLVGIAIGLGLGSWPWVRPVHARPDDRSLGEAGAADRVRSPLIEASRELARVAAGNPAAELLRHEDLKRAYLGR